ncbi:MAG: rRNA-processing protein and EBNA1-binding protein ebp2 [Alyxoria varia]|nr:MAG: rRNA-processing protein and EBNA1-binding protein ebp2 [Alyxoria varia]
MAKRKAVPAGTSSVLIDPAAEAESAENIPLPDSEASHSSADENGASEVEEASERETSIPLSDLSGAEGDDDAEGGPEARDEDEADIIPHQRLTINNTGALKSALERIQLLPASNTTTSSTSAVTSTKDSATTSTSDVPFSLRMSHTTSTPTSAQIPDTNDSINLELALYSQSLQSVRHARPLLERESIPFTRPADYFAEMVKSDEHMGKIREKMKEEAAGRKASEEAKRMREAKKFGKSVQTERLKERAKMKKDMLEKVGALKRKRKDGGGAGAGQGEEVDFDVALDDAAKDAKKPRREEGPAKGKGARGGRDAARGRGQQKRDRKDEKFGFGGKKRFAKSGDAVSTGDMRGFPSERGGGGGGRRGKSGDIRGGRGGGGGGRGGRGGAARGGGQKRPGKMRRASQKS